MGWDKKRAGRELQEGLDTEAREAQAPRIWAAAWNALGQPQS